MPKTAKLKNWDAVNDALARLAVIEPEVSRLQARLDTGVENLRGRYDPQIEPLQAEVKATAEAITDFVMENRAELSEEGGRRHRRLPAGTIYLRSTPPKLATVGRRTWDQVLAAALELRKSLRDRFIRTKQELDKKEIKAALDSDELDEDTRRSLGVALAQEEQVSYDLTSSV